MRSIYDLPVSGFMAITVSDMECFVQEEPLLEAFWDRILRRRSTSACLLCGNPFIVVDLPPKHETHVEQVLDKPGDVWF